MNKRNSVQAPSPVIDRLRKRREFVAMRNGQRTHSASFILQMLNRQPQDDGPVRIGFTVTKKNGNAVIRNRIKRRLRAAANSVFAHRNLAGRDFVLIGKPNALHEDYSNLISQLETCVTKIGKAKPMRETTAHSA